MTTKLKTTPKAAGLYLRISHDRTGKGLGVARQRDLCRKLATEKRWPVAQMYEDNDRSAYNGKRRPGYDRMLADIEAGRIDAVVCVDLDRLTRRPSELERFIEVADEHGVALANVSGDTDLSTSDGRFRARIMGSVARQESEKKAERLQRANEHAARQGIPRSTHRPFGYEADLRTIREDEAALVRDAAKRVIAGASVSSIARDWTAQGVEVLQGAKHGWSPSTVAGILRNPRYAALREYRDDVVAEGDWPAILDRATWEALSARMRPNVKRGRAETHLLSGILRCGRCGALMFVGYRHDKGKDAVRRYDCVARPGRPGCGKLAIVAEPVDALVGDAIVDALANPKMARALRGARDATDKRRNATQRDLTAAEAELDAIGIERADGLITRREWLTIRDRLTKRIESARRILERDYAADVLGELPADADALRAKWDDESIEWRRALVTRAFESITILPAITPGRFSEDRVELTWRV